MLTRRRFAALGAAALASPAWARTGAGLDLKAFGAVGDGTSDDGPALSRALTAAAESGAPLMIPPGRYLIASPVGRAAPGDPRPALRGGRIEIVGAGADRTTLVGPPLESRASGIDPVSRALLRMVGVERAHIRDLTLDGGVGAAERRAANGFSAEDASALLEIDGAADVRLERVTTTRNRHIRLRDDRTGRLIGRSGPVLVIGSSNVRVVDCASVYPSFTEGWWIFDCRGVVVERFRHVGPERFNPAATTSPLNIFGPRTEDVTIRGCDVRNALGSSLNLGGRGRFRVVDNRFAGVIAAEGGAPGRAAARPHEGAFGKGIDLGSEHQEDYFPDHPPMRDVEISRNRFENLFSYSVGITKTAACPLTGFVFRDNEIVHGFRGLMLRGVNEAQIAGCGFRRIVRYEGADRRAFGVTMSVEQCRGVALENATLDGSARPRLGTLGEGVSDVGLMISRSDDVRLTGNRFGGYDSYQLLADVGPDDDLRHGGFEVLDNAFEAAPGEKYQPIAMRLGRSAARRLARVTVRGNRFAPEIEDRVSVFSG
ncbi:glycosyl hydrolase family 28-related protein [Methylopila henanensis]|uniref:Glycosyl hydrolase family 28-related protein n=1 Tax=Methylopila henanensis TaxID=873516 RepID=A0ABW4K9Q0_9HYPH